MREEAKRSSVELSKADARKTFRVSPSSLAFSNVPCCFPLPKQDTTIFFAEHPREEKRREEKRSEEKSREEKSRDEKRRARKGEKGRNEKRRADKRRDQLCEKKRSGTA